MVRFLVLSLILTFPLSASAKVRYDDGDLSSDVPPAQMDALGREGGRRFRAASGAPAPSATRTVSGKVTLPRVTVTLKQGRSDLASEVTENGTFSLPIPDGVSGEAVVEFRLANAKWKIGDYAWATAGFDLPAAGGVDLGEVAPTAGSENARIALIHGQFNQALDLFEASGAGSGFWSRTLSVDYPANADYFSPWDFSVHLTAPEAWDVNLHELGHAIMAAGMRARGGGGQHKIDECYNEGLAWSEGWATFFAGAVALRADDPDAKFEYLVPRRAPIRLENVPDDVCQGDTSEWRVAAAMWDLYDLHVDGADSAALGFRRLWGALLNASMRGFSGAFWAIAAGLDAGERSLALRALAQNTIDYSEATPTVRLPAVEFDGR